MFSVCNERLASCAKSPTTRWKLGLNRLPREYASAERGTSGAAACAAPEAHLDGPALAARPFRLVAFAPAEEIELPVPFRERVPHGARQQHEPDRLACPTRIVTGLVVVELAAMHDSVDRSDRAPRGIQRVHAQHPRLREPLRCLAMEGVVAQVGEAVDRKSTRLNSSHLV